MQVGGKDEHFRLLKLCIMFATLYTVNAFPTGLMTRAVRFRQVFTMFSTASSDRSMSQPTSRAIRLGNVHSSELISALSSGQWKS